MGLTIEEEKNNLINVYIAKTNESFKLKQAMDILNRCLTVIKLDSVEELKKDTMYTYKITGKSLDNTEESFKLKTHSKLSSGDFIVSYEVNSKFLPLSKYELWNKYNKSNLESDLDFLNNYDVEFEKLRDFIK